MYAHVSGSLVNANDAVTVDTLGDGTVGLELDGTWTGTVTFEATVGGGTWVTLSGVPAGGGAAVTTATANGTWILGSAGFKQVRARFSTATSGTVAVALQSTASVPQGSNAAASTVTANQGSAGATPWPTQAATAGAPQMGATYTAAVSPAAATAVVASTPGTLARQSVNVQALQANTANVYIGGSGVALNQGIELAPGASATVPVTDPSTIFAITSTGTQKLITLWS